MLCKFCSNIDLDQLATTEGYKHHASCSELLKSAQNGCESCNLIFDAHWKFYGGDLTTGCDFGLLENQIIARVVYQKPGSFHSVRYGQEARWNHSKTQTAASRIPFLWCFLSIATKYGSSMLPMFLTSSNSADDPASSFLKLRVLPTRSLKDRLDLASEWLQSCLNSHQRCSVQAHESVHTPTRVIDVGPLDGSEQPYLRISNADVREWVTLSHCWGAVQPLKTTKESLSTHQAGLILDDLPRLFRDAINIVRAMKYRYLWIDSLCIIQDSEDDWQKEVSRMGDIYKHSVFMISAEFCHDSTESMFSSGAEKKYIYQGCHSYTENLRGTIAAYYTSDDEAQRLARGILRTRAWALQEEILSPRTLKWTQEQLVWECRTTTFSEEMPSAESSDDNHAESLLGYDNFKMICLPEEMLRKRHQVLMTSSGVSRRDPDPLVLWYRIVREYCHRRISVSADTLPAISGIAREVARHTGFDYRAGLWVQDIHNGLLWSTDGTGSITKNYAGPTWSWAFMCNEAFESPAGLLVDRDLQEDVITPVCEIISVDIRHSGTDEYSSVISGRIRIRGPCRRLSSCDARTAVLRNPEERRTDSHSRASSGYWSQEDFTYLWPDCASQATEDPTSVISELAEKDVVLVEIAWFGFRKRPGEGGKRIADMNEEELKASTVYYPGKSWGLMLAPTGDAEDQYERIGIARLSHDLPSAWESRVIKII